MTCRTAALPNTTAIARTELPGQPADRESQDEECPEAHEQTRRERGRPAASWYGTSAPKANARNEPMHADRGDPIDRSLRPTSSKMSSRGAFSGIREHPVSEVGRLVLRIHGPGLLRLGRLPQGRGRHGRVQGPRPREVEVFAGKTIELYLIPTKAGAYKPVCEIKGHLEAGMFGTITVTAAP